MDRILLRSWEKRSNDEAWKERGVKQAGSWSQVHNKV